MAKAIYSNYGSIESSECKTIDEARNLLHQMEDEGEGYSIGVYDEVTKTFFFTDNMNIFGRDKEDVIEQKKASIKSIGIYPDSFQS